MAYIIKVFVKRLLWVCQFNHWTKVQLKGKWYYKNKKTKKVNKLVQDIPMDIRIRMVYPFDLNKGFSLKFPEGYGLEQKDTLRWSESTAVKML